MNLERTKPETLAAGVMDYMPQSLAAHEYAERLNAALARLGLTDRLTLPSAPNTAIDELPAVVDVPLRKTLSVLMGKAQQGDASALATLEWTAQVAESIFAGLHARDFAGDRPLALPSHESLATLSQGVDALLPRKISTGWSVASLLADPTCDGIDDGVSLVRLLCSDAADSVTELKDDNEEWVMTKAFDNGLFPSCNEITINADRIVLGEQGNPTTLLRTVSSIKKVNLNATYAHCSFNIPADGELNAPNLTEFYVNNGTGPNCKIVYAPKLRIATGKNIYRWWQTGVGGIKCKKIVVGSIISGGLVSWTDGTAEDLIHLEFGADGLGGLQVSQNLSWWTATNVLSDSERLPIFLSNFQTYIADRVVDRTGKTALTLTLSAAVYEALQAQEGQTILATLTNKNWNVAQA